ncbi:MAG: OmpH family outer membrane protein [Deltaproteobacteria bacterium]|nr:OmpH family outer membrane protein [Deltaproteobacteria bacterium]
MNTAHGAPNNLKIAVVDLNQALNESTQGKKSKKGLMADKEKMQKRLKTDEESLKKLAGELSNMMLSKEVRAKKEEEVRERDQKLRKAVQEAQQELMEKERKATNEIFNQLKKVIEKIAAKEDFDMVLEKGASQVILYSSFHFQDITPKVIQAYDAQ